MFDNIGEKIKTLAKVLCWIGIIASVVGAIALWAQNSRYYNTIALGFGVLIGGAVGSWIGSFFMYGFGELIEETMLTRQVNTLILKELQNQKEPTKTPAAKLVQVQIPVAKPVQKQKTEETSVVQAVPPVAKKIEITGWTCPKCNFFNTASKDKCSLCSYSK